MSSPFNPLDLTERTILVTGASSGIGRGVAIYLSRLGARVVLHGRDRARLEKTLSLMEPGGHAIALLDLSECENIAGWFSELVHSFGVLHGLVHSAGEHFVLPLRSVRLEEAERQMKVNWESGLALAQAFRIRGHHGDPAAMVFLSSVGGVFGSKAVSIYSSTKSALMALGRALAAELAPEGIRVNVVAPGFVKSPLTDRFFEKLDAGQRDSIIAQHALGLGEPEDVAAAVAFLLSPAARWITGTTLFVDGGYSAIR